MESEFSIDIVLDKRYQKTSGLYPVKLWVYSTASQKAKRYPTKFSLSEKEFNSTWTPKPRAEHKDLKHDLEAVKSKAVKEARSIVPFSFELFEKKLFRKSGDGDNVFYHYQQVIEELTKNEQLGSASSYELSMESFKDFIYFDKTGKFRDRKESAESISHLSFTKVTADWLKEYENYMQKLVIINEGQKDEDHKKAKSATTVGIYCRTLRAVFNHAIKAKDIDQQLYPFGKKAYRITGITKVKKALNAEQLATLRNAQAVTSEQQKAKDFWFFIYSANGINIKDIALLRFENWDGETIRFFRAKTINTRKENRKEIVIYLNSYCKTVVEKYRNASGGPKDYLFPILSINDDAKVRRSKIQAFTKNLNTHIKKIAVANGLTGHISSYFARHSMATALNRKGVPITTIKDIMGHSSDKQTIDYIANTEDVTQREIMEELMNFESIVTPPVIHSNIETTTLKELLATVGQLPDESNLDLIALAESGVNYQYPPCCIIAFCKDIGKNKTPIARALDSSGFIPCKKHYREYKYKAHELKNLRVSYP